MPFFKIHKLTHPNLFELFTFQQNSKALHWTGRSLKFQGQRTNRGATKLLKWLLPNYGMLYLSFYEILIIWDFLECSRGGATQEWLIPYLHYMTFKVVGSPTALFTQCDSLSSGRESRGLRQECSHDSHELVWLTALFVLRTIFGIKNRCKKWHRKCVNAMRGLMFFITNMDTVQKGALQLIWALQCSVKNKKKEEEEYGWRNGHGDTAVLFCVLPQLPCLLCLVVGGEESKNLLQSAD